MSVLSYNSEAINAQELQVWNNAAFDNEVSEGSAMAIKASWTNMQHLYVNRSSDSLNSDCSKENLSPVFSVKQPPLKSSIPIKKSTEDKKEERERKIDSEIEEIEKEISRLSTRLEALRLKKAEQIAKQTMEKKRGRVIFPEFKLSAKIQIPEKKIEPKPNCRGVSLGPSEILAGLPRRAGVSLGPSDIFAGVRSNRPGKPELTPIQQTPNRRKSCFWKLPEIDEGKITKGRGGGKDSLSISPKSRKTITIAKQAFTTVGSKRPVKKNDLILGSVQPRKLFPASEKKPMLKAGRVIASRYNQTGNGNSIASAGRKRSFPEENEKGRASSCRSKGTEMVLTTSVKKGWEIPSIGNDNDHHVVVLPKIKMMKNEDCSSPRDSGPAKRVAELIGRKSFFCDDDDEGEDLFVCQELDFEGEDE